MHRRVVVSLLAAVVAVIAAPPFDASEVDSTEAVARLVDEQEVRTQPSPLQDLYPIVDFTQLRSTPSDAGPPCGRRWTRNPLQALSALWRSNSGGVEEERARTLTRTNALSREQWAAFVQRLEEKGMKRTTPMGALWSRGGAWLGKLVRAGNSATDRNPGPSSFYPSPDHVNTADAVWHDKHVVYEEQSPSHRPPS